MPDTDKYMASLEEDLEKVTAIAKRITQTLSTTQAVTDYHTAIDDLIGWQTQRHLSKNWDRIRDFAVVNTIKLTGYPCVGYSNEKQNMKNLLSVKQYRKAGYKIRVIHYRMWRSTEQPLDYSSAHTLYKSPLVPLSCGGITKIIMSPPNHSKTFIIGQARCRNDEHYNKKLGIHIALSRAIKEYERLKEEDPAALDTNIYDREQKTASDESKRKHDEPSVDVVYLTRNQEERSSTKQQPQSPEKEN